LLRAEACVHRAGAGFLRYANSLAALRERLAEERLQVAVLGQFKRGKSTFLNALLGAPLLPTGVVPLTAIATFIRWAAAPTIRVAYLDDRPAGELRDPDIVQLREQLARFVTEEGNPHNRLKVARVDLFYPAAILRSGIVLIDTPGVGSTLRHNTEAAIDVLPECDAGFFVLSADPPVTEAELIYLERVRPHVAQLFFILNKIDYLGDSDRAAAIKFLRDALREHIPSGTDIPVFILSARRAIEAKEAGDIDNLAASGLIEIERHLSDFLARRKTEALQSAVAVKAAALLDASRMDMALGIRALEMSFEDLELRAAQFTRALEDVQRRRLVARDLLAGDRRRSCEMLEARAAALRAEAQSALGLALDDTLKAHQQKGDLEDAAKRRIASAIPEFFGPKLSEVSRSFAAEIEAMLARHVREAESVIASVRQAAAALFEIPAMPVGEGEVFVMAREPFWVTQKWDETIGSFAAGALDKMLPASVRAARIRNRVAAQVDGLVQRNVENLRWATLQNIDDAFRRFSNWFDERLAETVDATRGAIETALEQRQQHAEAAEAALGELRRAAECVAAAKHELPASPELAAAGMRKGDIIFTERE
jgi:Dynamin family